MHFQCSYMSLNLPRCHLCSCVCRLASNKNKAWTNQRRRHLRATNGRSCRAESVNGEHLSATIATVNEGPRMEMSKLTRLSRRESPGDRKCRVRGVRMVPWLACRLVVQKGRSRVSHGEYKFSHDMLVSSHAPPLPLA